MVVRDRKCSVTFLSVVLPQHLVVIFSYRLQLQILHPAHSLYQGFSVTGYIRTGTGVKQTEVDCELTDGALIKQPLLVRTSLMNNDLPPDLTWFPHNFEML